MKLRTEFNQYGEENRLQPRRIRSAIGAGTDFKPANAVEKLPKRAVDLAVDVKWAPCALSSSVNNCTGSESCFTGTDLSKPLSRRENERADKTDSRKQKPAIRRKFIHGTDDKTRHSENHRRDNTSDYRHHNQPGEALHLMHIGGKSCS